MISVALKDQILADFIAFPSMQFSVEGEEEAPKYKISDDWYFAILSQFEELGLIKFDTYLGGGAIVTVSVKAHDFLRHGGFTGQEELLKANIQKLGLEIDLLCKELSPDLLDKAHKISELGRSILSVLGLMGS